MYTAKIDGGCIGGVILERIMIVNDDGELVCINDTKTIEGGLRSLVLINGKGLSMKLTPDGNGNIVIGIEDDKYKGKKTMRKCEVRHLIGYLSDWLEKDSWREV